MSEEINWGELSEKAVSVIPEHLRDGIESVFCFRSGFMSVSMGRFPGAAQWIATLDGNQLRNHGGRYGQIAACINGVNVTADVSISIPVNSMWTP